MKRYIKRDKSAENNLFLIYDELGLELYRVFRQKNNVVLSDTEGKKLLKIKTLPLPKLCAYSISDGKNSIKLIINPQKCSCGFYGTPWQIRGELFSGSFDIIDADNSLVCSHERSFSNGKSCYLAEIESSHNELLCLGTAVCADIRQKADKLCVQTV
ncbi:MAG: hypothetical protein IIU14_00380 [Ruminococcus sp.]|nr:hypothetical protein [Ruminococcus sp.]